MATKNVNLFDKEGYVELNEYLADIFGMMKNGPWKVPLGIGDRFNLYLLSLVNRFSWLSRSLCILNPHKWSPAYSVLYFFLQRKGFFDRVSEINLPYKGYYSYFFEKNIIMHSHVYTLSGQGVSTSREIAFSKGLGEIVERIVTGLGDMNKDILVSPYEKIKLRYPVVYPPKYHRFLEVQKKAYRELRVEPEKEIEWVLGENLVTKRTTYVPRQMTLWFKGRTDFKNVLQNATSNGCAGYFTKQGAVLRGLLEVVHRDSFLVHWLTTTPPEVVAQETLPESIREMIKGFTEIGVSIEVLNTTSIPIPSIMIVGISRHSDEPRIVVSGASSATFEEAAIAGLVEMMSLTFLFMTEKKFPSGKRVLPFVSDLNMLTRQYYWRGEEKLKEFEWFLSGEKVSFQEISKCNLACDTDDASRFKACLEVLEKMGEEYYPIAYYPTNKVQGELGFYLAQVYIPKAFPLYLFEYQGTFDSDRLKDFITSKNRKDFKLNPLPHMFS